MLRELQGFSLDGDVPGYETRDAFSVSNSTLEQTDSTWVYTLYYDIHRVLIHSPPPNPPPQTPLPLLTCEQTKIDIWSSGHVHMTIWGGLTTLSSKPYRDKVMRIPQTSRSLRLNIYPKWWSVKVYQSSKFYILQFRRELAYTPVNRTIVLF